MARYIDADKLINGLELSIRSWSADCNSNAGIMLLAYQDILHRVKNMPAADVAPKSYGKWKPYKDYFTHRQVGWICTNCSVVIRDLSNGDTNYCPYCGAIMETECEEEDE